jgi:hypothetical protein
MNVPGQGEGAMFDLVFKTVGVATALLIGVVAWAGEGGFPRLSDLMTAEEFEAAGIDKLDAEERAALEAWLVRYTARDAERIKKASPRVKKAEAKAVTAKLIGEFGGWTGRTTFYLDNGEVWRQIGSEQYYPRKKIQGPVVELHRGLLGGYQLELVDTGARVKVKRIK